MDKPFASVAVTEWHASGEPLKHHEGAGDFKSPKTPATSWLMSVGFYYPTASDAIAAHRARAPTEHQRPFGALASNSTADAFMTRIFQADPSTFKSSMALGQRIRSKNSIVNPRNVRKCHNTSLQMRPAKSVTNQ
ncbi:hypothetical protein [Methylobacterium phyllostachyos]|uniref:hypothetical protein n=1 Tax=Methylobacterium phyllostachyos TaxID=582672 RepID=UPI00115FE8F5|nr:hypothetical protein [Methylobacterium phyllostachyos]